MGLRSDIQDLLDLQGITGQFATAAQGLRQQSAQGLLNQQAPELIKSGDYGQLAGLASQAGDSTLMRTIVEKQLAAQAKPTSSPFKLPELQTLYPSASQEALQTIANINNRDDQVKVGGQLTNAYNAQVGAGLRREGINLSKDKDVQGQREDFIKGYKEIDKPYKEFEQKYANALAGLKDATKSGVGITLGFVARTLADEKGPLANNDIDRLVQQGFGKTLKEFRNSISQEDKTTLDESQLKTFQRLLEVAKSNKDKYFQEDLRETFQNAPYDFPKLFMNGNLDNSVRNRIGQKGINFNVGSDGKLNLSSGQKTSVIKQPSTSSIEGQGVDVKGLTARINKLPEGNFKNKALSKLNAFDGKSMTKKQYDEFVSVLDGAQ